MTEGNEPTLTVFHDETPIFKSYGKWLYPLFELEDYLAEHPMQLERLLLQDKIIGKAAALLGYVQSSCKKLHPSTHVRAINNGLMSKDMGGAFLSFRSGLQQRQV
jgi:hypothetical protein